MPPSRLPLLPLLLLLLHLLQPPQPGLALPICPPVLPEITDKVINGRRSTATYHISLASPPDPATRRCTATLISPTWALTAAHCAVNTSWSAMVAGQAIDRGTAVTIKSVFPHPSYKQPTDRRFDVAALHLTRAPSTASTVRLNPRRLLPQPDAFVRVSGFGSSTTETDSPYGDLLHADIPVVDFVQCSQLYKGTPELGKLDADRQLCAGYLEGGCDACAGDSGGPLVQFDAQGRPVQVAIVSASRGCALPGFPGISVRVDAVIPWLRSLGAVFETADPVQYSAQDAAPAFPSPTATPTPVARRPPPGAEEEEADKEPEKEADKPRAPPPRSSATAAATPQTPAETPPPQPTSSPLPRPPGAGTPPSEAPPTPSSPTPPTATPIREDTSAAQPPDTSAAPADEPRETTPARVDSQAASGDEPQQTADAARADAVSGTGVSAGVVIGGVFGGVVLLAGVVGTVVAFQR